MANQATLAFDIGLCAVLRTEKTSATQRATGNTIFEERAKDGWETQISHHQSWALSLSQVVKRDVIEAEFVERVIQHMGGMTVG